MGPYHQTKQLSKSVLRMSKDFTSFFYFTLEANENICFYSTLPFEKGQSFRDIVVHCTPELKPDFDSILKHLMSKASIEVIEECIIEDSL